jgi:serine/threonine protein kinase
VANYTSLATKLNTPHVYPSPQQCQSLSGDEQPYNPFKADVFSLGMVMLEAGLLAHQDDCYRHGKINWEVISYSLERFGDLYSLELRSMVELMLEKEEADRPGWGELVQYVKTEDGDPIPDTPRKEDQAGPQ